MLGDGIVKVVILASLMVRPINGGKFPSMDYKFAIAYTDGFHTSQTCAWCSAAEMIIIGF